MPAPGMRWRHLILNTRGAWLHGDERGFRSRGHRIHSSGDYKNPPPSDEHEGLRRYHAARSGEPIGIPEAVRGAAGLAFVERLRKEGCRVLALAVAGRHLHGLAELPDHPPTIRQIVGRCKRHATESMKPFLQGSVWSEGGEFRVVDDRDHEHNAYGYILIRQGADTWTWSYRDELGVPRFLGLEALERRMRAAERRWRQGRR